MFFIMRLRCFSISLLWISGALFASTTNSLAKLPISFERRANGEQEQFLARAGGYFIVLDSGSATIGSSITKVSIDFAGARKVAGAPGKELPGKVNYIQGSDPKHWQVGLSTYAGVTYREIYPGIDVVYRGNRQQMEFDLVLKPRADPKRIRLHFSGAPQLSVDADGALLIRNSTEELRLPLPAIYQDAGGVRRPIQGRYDLMSNFEVTFHLDPYDRTKPLVIDPAIVYTYLLGGGTGHTTSQTVATDSSGNAYIAGLTSASDFPTVNAAYPQFDQNGSGFISKIDPTGTTLLYSTYVGGMGLGTFSSIALDSAGDAWVAGWAFGFTFPVLSGYQATFGNFGPYGDAVVIKLSPTGVPLFSGYLGSGTQGSGVAVDPNGNAYVACNYYAAGTIFPATAGAYLTDASAANGFVAKLSPAGAIVYATYLTGTANAIAVDAAGSAYITGSIYSNTVPNAPPGGAQASYAGIGDAFVAKLNAAGSALIYFAFLGGSQADSGNAIAVDANGNAYVGGSTASPDFPVMAGALQTVFGGATDGFVAKLDSSGSAFQYVTYLGGSRVETVTGLAIDANGNAYVTGSTDSAQFPTASAIDGALPGNATSLYRTTDGGSTWAPFDGTIPGAVSSISPDPTPGVLVAATEFGIFRSVDSGQSWTQTSAATSSFLSRSTLNPSLIYEISHSNQAYRSVDGGITWNHYYALNTIESEILADPNSADDAWAYSLASTNRSFRFNSYQAGEVDLPCSVDALVAGSDGTVYADLYGPSVPGYPCGVDKIVGTGQGIFSGAPASITPVLNSLAISPSNPSVLYKSNGAAPVYVTTDGGATWSPTGIPPAPLGTLAVSATNPSLVYAAALAGSTALYTSTDGGVTWNPASGLGVAGIDQIVLDPTNGSAAYALAPVTRVAYAAEIGPTGNSLLYSTYLGSTGLQRGNGVAISRGDAFVAGWGYVPFQPAAGIFGQTLPLQTDTLVVRISGATAACTSSVTPATQMIYGGAATLMFDLLSPSGCLWSASVDQPWASIAQGSAGLGSSVIVVGVSANGTGATRTANLTLGGQAVSITQAPSSCSYSVTPAVVYVGARGGAVQTTVTTGTGCPWAVVNKYPEAISLTQGAAGTGSGTVTLSVAPVVLQSTRSFILTIGDAYLMIWQVNPCEVTLDTRPSAFDVQQIVNEALGLSQASDDLNQDGSVNAVDAQIVMNAVLGQQCLAK